MTLENANLFFPIIQAIIIWMEIVLQKEFSSTDVQYCLFRHQCYVTSVNKVYIMCKLITFLPY